MDLLAKRVVRKFVAAQEEACEMGAEDHEAVAPPGWEGPVKEMKKDKDIDNPWALAWHMKNKGDKPHKESVHNVVRNFLDRQIAARVALRFSAGGARERLLQQAQRQVIHLREEAMKAMGGGVEAMTAAAKKVLEAALKEVTKLEHEVESVKATSAEAKKYEAEFRKRSEYYKSSAKKDVLALSQLADSDHAEQFFENIIANLTRYPNLLLGGHLGVPKGHDEFWASAKVKLAELDAAKKKVKLPQVHKLEDLMVKLPFAVKVLDQKRGDRPTEGEVERLMVEYTNYVDSLLKSLDQALPKDAEKERRRAQELIEKVDVFRFPRTAPSRVLKGEISAEQFAKDMKQMHGIFHELEQLLKGQQVLIASGDKIDHSLAESEGHKGQGRFDDNKKQHTEMKSLLKKVEDANPSAKNKFDSAYDKMFENGEKAAAAAKKLLAKYEGVTDQYKGADKHQIEAALSMIERTMHAWENNKLDHHKEKGALAGAKMRQGENTYGYAQDLESFVKDFHKALKDPHMEVDESWRNH